MVAAVAVLLWLTTGLRLIAWLRARHPAQGLLLLIFGGLSVSATFFSPAMYVLLERVAGIPNVAEPVSRTGMLVAAWGAQELVQQLTTGSGAAYVTNRRRLRLLLLTVLSLWLLFVAAGVDTPTLHFTRDHGREPLAALYLLVSLAYLSFALVDVLLGVRRWAPSATPQLRVGLRLIGLGCLAGCGYVLNKLLAMAGPALRIAIPDRFESSVGRSLAVLAGLLVTLGCVVPWWARTATEVGSWWSARRALLALRPLWSDLVQVADISFHQLYPVRSPFRESLIVRGVHELLYRRVIEIRDGRLAIRQYLDAAVEHDARLRHAGDSDLEAAVESALLTAAIAAAHKDKRPQTVPESTGVSGGADLEAEVRWLTRVARFYPDHAVLVAAEQERIEA
jgi:hypothetical protein